MRPLREDERDEIEAVKYLIKYVVTAKNIEAFKIWDAMKKLDEIAKKYVLTGIVSEEELSELTDFDDSKELVTKFIYVLIDDLEKIKEE